MNLTYQCLGLKNSEHASQQFLVVSVLDHSLPMASEFRLRPNVEWRDEDPIEDLRTVRVHLPAGPSDVRGLNIPVC